MKSPKLWLALGLLVTFVLGVFSGVALYHIQLKKRLIHGLAKPPAEQRARLLTGMLRLYFRLSQEQQKQVYQAAAQMMHKQAPAFRRFRQEVRPHQVAFYKHIKTLLTPAQRKKWPELLVILKRYARNRGKITKKKPK